MNKKSNLRLGVLVLAGLAVSAPLLSQHDLTGRDPQKLWALIIGVSNYAHAQPLLYAAQDAAAVSDFLESPRGRSFPKDHVFTLLEDQATRTAILKAFDLLGDKVRKGDTVVIYIAGHGFTKRGVGYYVPSDGSLDEITSSGVPFSHLRDLVDVALTDSGAARRILVTDMCNAGRLLAGRPELPQKIQNLVNEELLKLGKTPGGAFLNLLASRPTEASWENDELGGGVFTNVLLEALNGKAADGKAPVISAKYVIDYLNSEVPKYTANTQHPMFNSDYDPSLELSYLDQPGPEPRPVLAKAILQILNIDKSPYSRVQWMDPVNRSDSVRQLPRNQSTIQISSLPPGELNLEFYDPEERPHPMKVNLQPGKNDLDLTKTGSTQGSMPAAPLQYAPFRATRPRAVTQVAALQPSMMSQSAPAMVQAVLPASREATLLMQVERGTQVFVDALSYGTAARSDHFLQLQGLAPGYHNLTLIPSPDRERRFRVRLFQGAQIFDPPSGEMRTVSEVQLPPDSAVAPPDLPAGLAQDYLKFRQALWQEHLILPAGESAWDYFQRLQAPLPAALREKLQGQLAIAMGDRAQRMILKYLRGGDIAWNAAVFDEGAELLDRTQRLFKASTAFEAQKHFFAGRASIERGEYAQALPELQRALAVDPEAAYANNALGLALWKQNRLQEAIQPLERSIQQAPNWTYPRDTLALIYLEQRLYADAERQFLTSTQINSQDSAAYHGMAQIYLLQSRYAEAEDQLRRAVEVNPGNAYAYDTLGKLYRRQQRNSQAEQAIRLAIRLEPDEPSFQLSLGELLRQTGRVREAEPILARVADGNPNNLMVLQAYASFLTDEHKLAEAEKIFKRAFTLSPEDSNLRVGYGLLLQEQGRGGDAEKEFKAAVRIRPDNAYAHYNLASIYVARKKLADAEKELTLAQKADARFAKTPLLMGRIRWGQSRHLEALEQYRKALALSIDAAQKQEIEGYVEEAESAIAGDKLGQAKAKSDAKAYRDAWSIYADALKSTPDHRPLRDAILRFQEEHPAEADVLLLPPSNLTSVLKTAFWKNRRQAEQLWQQGEKSQATELFIASIERLEPAERRVLAAPGFNIGNQDLGTHAIIHRWGLRLIGEKNYAATLKLMDAALKQNIFARVPDFSPLTVDSLMVPSDVVDPRRFSDFEVAHHPDRGAHEVYAAAYAGMGETTQARQYLAALEAVKPDLEVRMRMARSLRQEMKWEPAIGIIQEVIGDDTLHSDPELFAEAVVLLAEIQCQSGDCAAGRKTLERGLQALPGNQKIREGLRKL